MTSVLMRDRKGKTRQREVTGDGGKAWTEEAKSQGCLVPGRLDEAGRTLPKDPGGSLARDTWTSESGLQKENQFLVLGPQACSLGRGVCVCVCV